MKRDAYPLADDGNCLLLTELSCYSACHDDIEVWLTGAS
jgi:hypothetical protein